MSVLPNDYDSDPDRFLSTEKHPHDDVHPYVAARFAAAGARTVLDVGGGNGRLARLLPALSIRCLLVDLSPAMLDLAPRPKARVLRPGGMFAACAANRPTANWPTSPAASTSTSTGPSPTCRRA